MEVVRPRTGVAVVVLRGEHGLETRRELDDVLARMSGTCDLVVVDLSSVEFIDSSILAACARADRSARASGKRFRLQVGSAPAVRRILEVSGILGHIESAPTRESAVAD